ncbi:ABC transporter ATP-binding protein [Listeria cornellensis]|uniref:Teichoic acids export protein ATP-binding subunit n=1 Tax=Listeria cornellensis FSL F6-0969 TaxID=1265820 RepID=W7C5H6_9LIST|nr:ABC transporter ATP-binding protein [Listeria cornellensis]EUJ27878.1 teichoic acids export protein ATP-binding subunit [Listeria cornellensis FSL F6-0969]
MTESMVSVTHVSKQYSMITSPAKQLRGLLKSNREKPTFLALRDVSFEVGPGETVGLIGLNGSGKSTLTNILAGIIQPTHGKVHTRGEVSLLAIGAGLKPTLSGMENIRMKCLMLGYSNQQIAEMIPAITDFADLHDFIDQPIKRYSSGMKARLGFAIAVQIDPDILIIDEALSVGDTTFYTKCTDKIEQFQEEGKTIFFVSHALSQVRTMCDRIIWLHYGEVRLDGPAEEVGLEYSKFVHHFNKLSKEEKTEYQQNLKKRQNNTNQIDTPRTYKQDKANGGFRQSTIVYLSILWTFTIFSAIAMESGMFFTKLQEIIANILQFGG